ncbi:hypothetical protein [Actinoplanes auranticolor]|uniref:Uncharacterized protein n=1 Tax=Actinoplanes auranticolor TaxID=47988 RepID=A0A919VWE1_9ACTN|nr:hypothetical protein [Actinoplanes auranticolor]GIM71743.1 hypothetical protein Aau02nite_47480 [Actinoplanes auranticolor]
MTAMPADRTILRSSAFMSNPLQSAGPIARGWYPQTTGRGAIPWTDTEDIARVTATVLQADAHTERITGRSATTLPSWIDANRDRFTAVVR